MRPLLARATVGAMVLIIGTTSSVLAWSGESNGSDYLSGQDNPGATGSYSVDNTWQDFYLSEWSEPSHDWARDRYNRWSSTTYNNVLYPQRNSKALGFQLTIVDQYWYNYTGSWATNLPYTKAAENENPIEELLQGYTEVDTEINDPSRIVAGVNYYIDYQIDSERSPSNPRFESEIEWCDKSYITCNWDITGVFYKTITVQ